MNLQEIELEGLSPDVKAIVEALQVKLAKAQADADRANAAGDYWMLQACEARIQAEKYRQAWASARRRGRHLT